MKINHRKIFGADAAEYEDEEKLSSYFVIQNEFERFTDSDEKFLIVKAKKGMGKSSLLRHTSIEIKKKENTDIVIEIKGNELLGLIETKSLDNNQLENLWKKNICNRICIEIGKNIGFAATDTSINFVESAELEGFKEKNIISILAKNVIRIFKIQNGTEKISDTEIREDLKSPHQQLIRYQESKDSNVWLIVDDIDAKFQDDENNRIVVSSFFSAACAIAHSVYGLKIRSSVRSDVWTSLRNIEDQDKLRDFIVDIHQNDAISEEIIFNKISAYLKKTTGIDAHYKYPRDKINVISKVFENPMNWNKGSANALIVLKVLAGGRPRWMGQLCKEAGKKAGGNKITLQDFISAMPNFGRDKISDIEKEHKHQFDQINSLINSFRAGSKDYTRHKLIQRIENFYTTKNKSKISKINGAPFKASEQLAKFLFEVEFFVAFANNDYINFEQSPDLFDSPESLSNTIKWTINSSYRNYLNINQ
ncbi:P-loop ATPase, Sll1717 family [Simplicispira metamorpha]|nr:hypothetical protein [Simplicispira metamorpha]